MKVKVSSPDGVKFDVFISFTEPFPEKNEGNLGSNTWMFLNRKDHLYRFERPRVQSTFCYISIRSQQFQKIEIIVFFSDPAIESIRKKNQ